MKLYTEEQVRKAALFSLAEDATMEKILDLLTPIELPSDDKIEEEAYYKVSDHTENPYASFKSGAKWLKEQILNQNK